MSDMLSEIGERIREWRHNTAKFAYEVFGMTPDKWQEEAFAAWDDPSKPRIAMQACAGPGKSAVEAICGWHFLICQGERGEHPNAFALSMDGENLKSGLWKEFAVWYGRALPFVQKKFEWQKEQIIAREFPATWWIRARSWSKKADAESQGRTLSGLHGKYIAYFIDEAGEVPTPVGRAAEQGLATGPAFGKILIGGNATSHDGLLYEAANTHSHLWHPIRVTGDPLDPNRSPRIPIAYAQQQIDLYGRTNAWVMAFILGQFPPSSLNALLGPDDVRTAMERTLADHVYLNLQKRIGVDVARFGDDATVIFPRQGLRAFEPVEMRGARTDAIAGRIALAKKNWDWELAMIDSTGGWSAGVEDQCRLGGIDLLPINFSSSALDPRYFNRRSEMYFLAAEWVKGGGWLPNIPSFVREACAARYWFDHGKLRVLEKEQIKLQLQGHSPDTWDAFMLTFALPDMPASVDSMLGIPGFRPHGQLASEWDPFDEKRGGVLVQ